MESEPVRKNQFYVIKNREKGKNEENRPHALPALCDGDLFARFVDGENGAYTVLYHRYAARLNGYIRSLLGTDNLAVDDVFQETFLRLFRERRRRLDRPTDPLKNVGGWLFRVARNLSLNQIRSENYLTDLPEGPIAELVTTSSEAFSSIFGGENDEEELLQRVYALVDELPVTLREVFLLREVNGMSYEETSEIVGCSMEAARMRLSRARSAIRAALTRDEEGETERVQR